MVPYSFYTGDYFGDSLTELDFMRLCRRAEAQLDHYKRIYTVVGDTRAESMAVCAMADALYYFETATNGGIVTSSSVGSVSSSQQAIDISLKAQAEELYRCARLYLTIYRGRRKCYV